MLIVMMFQRFASIEMSNKVMNAANNFTLVVCAALFFLSLSHLIRCVVYNFSKRVFEMHKN